ncbi:nucleotide exchange factor GrpE [Patiriisocius marinus]|uniref:Protein GrpE n=1 Tax=Patiriisocius marinus TaxID=1397112 RepID=A0A5J4IPU0_9FLAO|nr:nucleotide exchange factor GrpE [Patiriisocius marinus]GER59749.1 protein GrpE [Patiriisocius marinus]
MSEETKNTDAALEGELLNDVTIDEGNTVDEAEAEMSTEEKLNQELQQEKEKFLRLFAEFENYKKRTSKERMELFKTAGQEVMVSMLPVLDDFERALKDFSDDKDDVHVQGMILINNKLNEALKQKGLTVSETAVGDTFNADLHEAITQIPAPSDDMKGKIIDIIEKGYALGDKIIRYPKVVIGQ